MNNLFQAGNGGNDLTSNTKNKISQFVEKMKANRQVAQTASKVAEATVEKANAIAPKAGKSVAQKSAKSVAPKANAPKESNAVAPKTQQRGHRGGEDNLHVPGNLCVTGDAKIRDDLRVGGNVHISGDLCVTEDIHAKSSLRVSERLHVDDDASVEGDLSVDGDLNVEGVTSIVSYPVVNLSINEDLLECGDRIRGEMIKDGIVAVEGNNNSSSGDDVTYIHMPHADCIVRAFDNSLNYGDTVTFLLTCVPANPCDVVFVCVSDCSYDTSFLGGGDSAFAIISQQTAIVNLRYVPEDECPKFQIFVTGGLPLNCC